MTKTITVTTTQYDWFAARARRGRNVIQVIDLVISLVDRYEADLEKYRKWVDATNPRKESSHEALPLE